MIGIGVLQFVCFIGCRYFTAKLYEANLVKKLLYESDEESESDRSDDEKTDACLTEESAADGPVSINDPEEGRDSEMLEQVNKDR